MKRREFLRNSALAVVGAAVAASPLPAIADTAQWTGGLRSLNPDEAQTLLRMTRQIYPHDALDDACYIKVVRDLDSEAAADPATAKLLSGGVKRLNRMMDAPFVRLSDNDQVAALRKIEKTKFFQKVQSVELVTLYNNHDVWKKLGYQGASYQMGGYLHHGFNDLDWLPDPPESASPKPA